MAENELSESEKREKIREVALKNLESSLWKYATPKLVSQEQYGMISKMAGADYQNTLSQTPDQNTYEQLFYPQLASEGGAITSPYLQVTSTKILQESVMSLKVEDVYKLMKLSKPMKASYQGKYISELDKEEIQSIVGSYMQNKVTDIVTELLGKQKQGISKGLEEILCEEEQKELSK